MFLSFASVSSGSLQMIENNSIIQQPTGIPSKFLVPVGHNESVEHSYGIYSHFHLTVRNFVVHNVEQCLAAK